MIWTKSKINYAFVFEYDTRHTLEWRELLEVRASACQCINLRTDLHLDTIFLHLLDGFIHVAQFFVDQFHVHILARRPDWPDGHHHFLACPSAVSPQPEVVCLFKCE